MKKWPGVGIFIPQGGEFCKKEERGKECRKVVEAPVKRVNAYRRRSIRAFVNVSDKDRTQHAGISIYASMFVCVRMCVTMVLLSCGRHFVLLTN